MLRNALLAGLLAAGLCSIQVSANQAVIHVNASAAGANDGSSWADAYTDLHDALASAKLGMEIWVAAGIYEPGESESFHLAGGVALYGGFAGNETELEERDWKTNETILRRDGLGPPILIGVGLSEGSVLDGLKIRDGLVPFVSGLAAGGAMWLADSSLHIANCAFINNGADDAGGAIYALNSAVEVEHCNFLSNTTWYGGAIFAIESTLNILGSSFTSNGAAFGGGAVYAEDSEVHVTYSSFSGGLTSSSGFGGAITALQSSLLIANSLFQGNDAGQGGAIWTTDTVLVADHCTFERNVVEFAVSAIGAGGSVHIVSCTFIHNEGGGGTVEAFGTVENTFFIENIGSGMIGGGTIRNCQFIGNDGLINAGGLRAAGKSEISDCFFHDNFTHVDGGGLIVNTSGVATVTNCQITSNLGTDAGGLLAAGSGEVRVIDSLLHGNGAFLGGGAAVRDGSLTLIGCIVSDNGGGGLHATQEGALNVVDSIISGNGPEGILLGPDFTGAAAQATIINSVISGNIGDGVRMGFPSGPSNAAIINSTIANNQINFPFQAGIAVAHGSAEVRNSILWGNGEGLEEQQVSGGMGMLGDIEISHSIIQNLDPDGVFDVPGAFNLGDDPLFVDAANGDFRLQMNSPAIDAGSNAFVPEGIETDLDGNPRFVDGLDDGDAIVDIGAYEFQPGVVPIFGDLNGDGIVNHQDIVILVHSFGPCPGPDDPAGSTRAGSLGNCPADLNGDGVVNAQDLLILLGEMTPSGSGGPQG